MTAIKVKTLKSTCSALATDLLQSGSVTADALRAVKPGGSQNPNRDGAAWLRFYGQLQLLRGRAQGPAGSANVEASPAVRESDAFALAALAEQPSRVTSAPGFSVYPKSFAALLHCHAREILLGHLARVVGTANRASAPNTLISALNEAADELAYQTRLLAWIATSRGPGLPFGDADDPTPALPPEIVDLTALVVLDINRTFARVNWSSLKAMEALITPDEETGGPPKRLAWSPFFGSLSLELHENPVDLLRNRSLASVLASTQLAASTRREAMADAKEKSARERAQRGDA
jgi:hypothetical protein